MKESIIVVILLTLLLVACAPEEIPPTSTPKPTWTPRPMGTLKACMYFEGTLIKGNIDIKDPVASPDTNLHEFNDVDCVEKDLPPGEYLVWGMTREGDDCSEENTTSGVGCQNESGEGIPFSIELNQVTEVDINVIPY